VTAGMRSHFRDVVILAFLIPEVFAGFFNRSLAMKRSSSNETIPAPVVIPPSEYCKCCKIWPLIVADI